MSISGLTGISADSNALRGTFDNNASGQAVDPLDDLVTARLSDTATNGELLSEMQTNLEKLAGVPSTFEQLSGSSGISTPSETLEAPIVLAQSSNFIPDPIIQELHQQLQPLQDGLEGMLGQLRLSD